MGARTEGFFRDTILDMQTPPALPFKPCLCLRGLPIRACVGARGSLLAEAASRPEFLSQSRSR